MFGVLFPTLLADACLRGTRLNEGLSWINVATAAAGPEGYYLPEAYRVKAELLHALGAHEAEVQGCFGEAISIARAQHARLFELRATVSQCRICVRTKRRTEAVKQLRETFDWFSEGFETVDLMNARTMLQELSK